MPWTLPAHEFTLRLGRLQHVAIQGALELATRTRREVLVLDGVRVPVARLGRGRPLLLVHGFGDRGESMLPLAALLHREFECVIPDLPGYGDADEVSSDRATMQAQVRCLTRLLDAVGFSRAHLLGQSMGGGIVALLAHDLPERVLSLTLLAPAGPLGLHPEVEAWVAKGRNPLVPRNHEDFEVLLGLGFANRPPFTRAHLRYVGQRWTARQDEHARHFDRLSRPLPGEGVPLEMQPIRAPARLVYGRQEKVVHPHNLAMYERILANSQTVILDRVGHAPHVEVPARVARIVREVVQQSEA